MKKVLVAGAALMLVSGIASTASAAAVEPGVKITGDARARIYYKSAEYYNDFGNKADPPDNHYSSSTDMDSRVRFNVMGTAAGGAYAFGRIRLMESLMGDMDQANSSTSININNQNNIWVDQAYLGIPFGDSTKIELGKFRNTFGPLPTTYNLFYDDVDMTGGRAIIKAGQFEITPFIVWMDEAQNKYNSSGSGTVIATTQDTNEDNDEIRYGAHVKFSPNKEWTFGGLLGYQSDERREAAKTTSAPLGITQNSGGFGSIYTNGKMGAFGVAGELAVVAADLNGFNSWLEDSNNGSAVWAYSTRNLAADAIGSNDTGFGGYIRPTYTIDKLELALNTGFTTGGFLADRAFGFVMLGSHDNSAIFSVCPVGSFGDWFWIGFSPTYTFNESLKLTGNIVYATINAWENTGDGPGFVSAIDSGTTNATRTNVVALDSAWELSAVLQYTISKGMDVYFSAGYLMPDFEYVKYNAAYRNPTSYAAGNNLDDDGAFGANMRFELKF